MSIKKRYLSLLTGPLVLSVLVAAGYFLSKKIAGIPETRVPEYSDPARPVKTRTGDRFVIVLDSNPTTGYGWQLGQSFDKTAFEVLEIRYEPSNDKRLAGAGGKQTWMFRALRAGNAVIDFEYLRPWEKDIPPVKKIRFAVTVRQIENPRRL
jgi:inhibitor of cysteine peptidase